MIPELKKVTLDGKPVTNETEYLKEFPTSVYMSVYSKWSDCKDSKERTLTVLVWKSTTLLLSLWEDDTPYLRKFATEWLTERQVVPEGGEVTPIVLPMDLPSLMREISPDEFVRIVDSFADSLPKYYMDDMTKIMDDHIAPMSDEKKTAEKND